MQKEKKKIVLIGPVYPYKGGISHYTGLLHKELAREHEVIMLSYKMQYPRLLFRAAQKDYDNDSFKVENTDFRIHTANPFNIIKTAKYIKSLNPDMVIIQWWHPYFAPCYRILELFMGRQNLVFVCHNVFPHARFPFDRALTKSVLKRGKHFIVHAREEGDELEGILPNPDYRVTPHPTYNAFQFENITKKQARKRLHIRPKEKILLFFGFVKTYKGLMHLLHAMPDIVGELENVRLMIVGDFDHDKEHYLWTIKELGIGAAVTIVDGYVSDREVEKYFAACDIVVLPYQSATQSGIVQIAYGFDKPVIVTDVGGLPDVVDDDRTGYVVEHCNPQALADVVIQFFKENRAAEFEANIKQEAYRFSWERMGEVVDDFF